jgi:hypothetical protein
MSRRLVAILALVVIVAGCGGGGPAPAGDQAAADPMNPCVGETSDSSVDAGMIPLTCDLAIDLANERLGWLHWPVTAIEFHRSLCPPNARCAFPVRQGWVMFSFWSGDPVMIHVGPVLEGDVETARFTAGEPEPPPDWLLEERATRSGS